MLEANLFRLYTEPLNRLGIVYMATGSVASMVYGEPRLTHDIDIVLRLPQNQLASFLEAFSVDEFYVPPAETIQLENRLESRGHFNLLHHQSGFKADIYLDGKDPLHIWALEKRRVFDFLGNEIWVAPPEYVIIRKLEFFEEGGTEKHLRDIGGMLQMTPVNQADLERWLKPSALQVLRDLIDRNAAMD